MSKPGNFNGASSFQSAFPTNWKDFSYGPEGSHSHRKKKNAVPWRTVFLWTGIGQVICPEVAKNFLVVAGNSSKIISRQSWFCKGARQTVQAKPRFCLSKQSSRLEPKRQSIKKGNKESPENIRHWEQLLLWQSKDLPIKIHRILIRLSLCSTHTLLSFGTYHSPPRFLQETLLKVHFL